MNGNVVLDLIYEKPSKLLENKLASRLPNWINSNSNFYEFGNFLGWEIYFFEPKKDLAFDQIVNIQKQAEKILEGLVIVLAGALPSRFRPVLVREGIPFLIPGKTIFAPELGLKLSDLDQKTKTKRKKLDNAISPFELKLVAGFLTNHHALDGWMNVTSLIHSLNESGFKSSLRKTSEAINNLIGFNYIETRGNGPFREFKFTSKAEIWEDLKEREITKFFKRIEVEKVPRNLRKIQAGQNALSLLSNISETNRQEFAVSISEYNKFKIKKFPELSTNSTPETLVLLKEDPEMFCLQIKESRCLNPVELFFIMRNDNDIRIKESLKEAIQEFVGINNV